MDDIRKFRSIVFGSLEPGTIEIHVGYGYGLIDGRSLYRVDYKRVPQDCRTPNTYIWITTKNKEIIKIERMTKLEIEENRQKF